MVVTVFWPIVIPVVALAILLTTCVAIPLLPLIKFGEKMYEKGLADRKR